MPGPGAKELPITLALPKSLLREIGRIVSHYAALEAKLNRVVYELMGIDPVAGRIAVREPRSTDRLEMIVDLIKLRGISVKADISAIREALKACATDRDAIAHGLWFNDPDHPGKLFLRILSGNWIPTGTKVKSKRRIDPQALEYDAEHAKDLVELIDATGQAIYDLGEEIHAALQSSHEKSQ